MRGDVLRRRRAAEGALNNPILQMLSRPDASWMIALIESVFINQSERLAKSELLERLEGEASTMLETGDLPARFEGRSDELNAKGMAEELLDALVRPQGTRRGWEWIRIDVDLETRESFGSLSNDAISALDLLDRLNSDRSAFTGTKAEDLQTQVNELRGLLKEDTASRIKWLEERVRPYLEEMAELRSGGKISSATPGEVAERLEHIISLIAPMPAAVRRVAESERDAAMRLEADAGAARARRDLLLIGYVDGLAHRLDESEDGKSFNRARGVLFDNYFEEGIEQLISETLASPSATSRVRGLCDDLDSLSTSLRDELQGVDAARSAGERVLERLTRAGASSRYEDRISALAQLRSAFSEWSRRAKGRNPDTGIPLPYGGARRPMVASSLGPDIIASAPRKVTAPPLNTDPDLLSAMLRTGAPRTAHVLRLILKDPVLIDGLVDVGGSFNLLPEEERLTQEVPGILELLGTGSRDLAQTWEVIDLDLARSSRRTMTLLVERGRIEEVIESLEGHA